MSKTSLEQKEYFANHLLFLEVNVLRCHLDPVDFQNIFFCVLQ